MWSSITKIYKVTFLAHQNQRRDPPTSTKIFFNWRSTKKWAQLALDRNLVDFHFPHHQHANYYVNKQVRPLNCLLKKAYHLRNYWRPITKQSAMNDRHPRFDKPLDVEIKVGHRKTNSPNESELGCWRGDEPLHWHLCGNPWSKSRPYASPRRSNCGHLSQNQSKKSYIQVNNILHF